MSLQDAANEIMKSGWNAKTDSANDGFDNLKPGTYEVMLDKVNHAAFSSGYECINFSFQVIAGADAGRKEFVHVNLADKKKDGTPMSDFVVSKNIKLLFKIAALSELQLTPDDLAGDETGIYERVVGKFNAGHEGQVMQMKITESPNKKDPSSPYRNYDFAESDIKVEQAKAPQDPFAGAADNIDDSDLPF